MECPYEETKKRIKPENFLKYKNLVKDDIVRDFDMFGEDAVFKFGVFDGIPSLVRAVVSALDFG